MPWPLVIFATAFDRYALAAFEANALGYLLKPVNSGYRPVPGYVRELLK
jgi:DNA-binding LytR/AlgR family response regulator